MNIISAIAGELNELKNADGTFLRNHDGSKVRESQVDAAVKLIDEGNTIPFIARYRKEATGELNDEQLRFLGERLTYLRGLEDRKTQVLASIELQDKLTDDLRAKIEAAETLVAVEDLYRPYRPKRKTRASVAKAKGLEPLADFILEQNAAEPVLTEAGKYVTPAEKLEDPEFPEEKKIRTAEDALQGAKDILAEKVSDDADLRTWIRNKTWNEGVLVTSEKEEKAARAEKAGEDQKKTEPPELTEGSGNGTSAGTGRQGAAGASVKARTGKATNAAVHGTKEDRRSVYEMYFQFEEKVSELPGHRVLAINRGENEKYLNVKLNAPEEDILGHITAWLLNHCEPLPEPAVTEKEQNHRKSGSGNRSYDRDHRRQNGVHGQSGEENPRFSGESGAADHGKNRADGHHGQRYTGNNGASREHEGRKDRNDRRNDRNHGDYGREREDSHAGNLGTIDLSGLIGKFNVEGATRVTLENHGGNRRNEKNGGRNGKNGAARNPKNGTGRNGNTDKSGTERTRYESADMSSGTVSVSGKVAAGGNPFTTPILEEVAKDAYERLIAPAIEREIRGQLTENAEDGAISVFRKNLEQLLMQPPIAGKVVLGWDPAFRTGCKISVVDPTGKVLDTTVVFPTEPQNKVEETKKEIKDLIRKDHVDLISLGNGTASRESEQVIVQIIQELQKEDPTAKPVQYIIVNEAGASVYSASKLATEEFPNFDVGQRSATSMARRLQDPLAELVKIDPKAIGVGQYQHDMNQKKLGDALEGVVEDVVNRVGVDLNTASFSLLSYVSGISGALAKNIVAYREANGQFRNRKELMNVPKLGPKAFEQSAGFLRIREGDEPLDATAVHPEDYEAVKKLLSVLDLPDGMESFPKVKSLAEKYASEKTSAVSTSPAPSGTLSEDSEEKSSGSGAALQNDNRTVADDKIGALALELGIGEITLKDILDELEKPGRDPRADLPAPVLRSDVLKIEDLKPGMKLKGTVRNIVDFGAFVDIGVHQDGLVHISRLTDHFIKHPLEVVHVGQVVDVEVVSVDPAKKRIALTMNGKM